MDDQTTSKIENVLRNTDVKRKFKFPKIAFVVPPLLVVLFLFFNSNNENSNPIGNGANVNGSSDVSSSFYFGNIIYILGLILFAVGIGFLVTGLLFFFVKMERKQGIIATLIGIGIIAGSMFMYEARPPFEAETEITVINAGIVKHSEEHYRCFITEQHNSNNYYFDSETEEEAVAMCSQFELNEEYTIKYQYYKNEYWLIEKLR